MDMMLQIVGRLTSLSFFCDTAHTRPSTLQGMQGPVQHEDGTFVFNSCSTRPSATATCPSLHSPISAFSPDTRPAIAQRPQRRTWRLRPSSSAGTTSRPRLPRWRGNGQSTTARHLTSGSPRCRTWRGRSWPRESPGGPRGGRTLPVGGTRIATTCIGATLRLRSFQTQPHSSRVLPSEKGHNKDQRLEHIPSRPYYDPTSALDTFHALHISNLLGKSPFNNVFVDPIPRSASPMSLSFSHYGSSRRGPSLPSNPRPQPWHPAPVSRDASHPSTYDSMSQPPWQGLNTHSGPFDDLGSTSSLTLNPPSAPLVPGDYNYLYAAASEDSGRAGLGLE